MRNVPAFRVPRKRRGRFGLARQSVLDDRVLLLAEVGDEIRWRQHVWGPTKFRVVNALPSVKSNIITPFAPSGELPETVVPPVPTAAGAGVPWTESPSFALAASSALAAAAGSRRTRMVSWIWRVLSSLLKVVSTPAWPFGFGITGPAVKAIGVWMSVTWINSRA